MNMTADLWIFCHHCDQFVRQILRVRSHKADPLQTFDLYHLFKKLGKTDRMLQSFTVGIDILSQQHDFHYAIFRQSADLFQDFLRLTALLATADIGHDTVAAEIVAAKHDVYSGFEAVFAVHRQILHDLLCVLPGIHHHLISGKHLIEKLRELVQVVSAKDQIDKAVTLFDFLDHLILLHHAAAECNL